MESLKRISVIGLIIGLLTFGLFAGWQLSHQEKVQGGGFYTQLSQQFQQYYSTSTPSNTTSTIATIPIAAVTSSLHMVIDITANAATSTAAAGYHCVADWKRSSSTVDIVLPIGSTICDSNESVSLWDVAVTTTAKNVVVNVSGQAGNTIDWGALVYSLNIQ